MSTSTKSWAELTELEQAQTIYWNVYKDAYGVRPRNVDMSEWTLEEFKAKFEVLSEVIQANEIAREAAESAAIELFEVSVAETIKSGAKSRETALCWLMDAANAKGDWEYFSYLHGLPYNYFY